MNVLFVVTHYYPYIGGVEYVVKSVAERLTKLGHEVTVLAGEPTIDRPVEEFVGEVRVIKWPTWSPNDAYHVPKRRSGLAKLLAELAKEYDVVHVHSAHAALTVWSGLKLKRYNPSFRLVFTLHYHETGHTLPRKLLWSVLWRKQVSKLVEVSDKIHAVSLREARLIKKHYPEARSKIVVISNGVDEDVSQYRWRGQNSDYMTYAGRIEKYKRLGLAVDLAKQLSLKLVILGDGSYKRKLAKYAEKHYPGKVEFYPPQPRPRYLEILSKARYAVNPSRHEAYSIFIAEALKMGAPAIVSREVAENLETVSKPFNEGLVLAVKAPIKTWNEVVQIYLNKLYRNGKI